MEQLIQYTLQGGLFVHTHSTKQKSELLGKTNFATLTFRALSTMCEEYFGKEISLPNFKRETRQYFL